MLSSSKITRSWHFSLHTQVVQQLPDHRAQRSQIGLQIRPIFTVQIDLVGAKLQTFNIRDMML